MKRGSCCRKKRRQLLPVLREGASYLQINPDNAILVAMSKAWDAMVATLLFVLCSLPVLTFGAALTAVFSTMMAISKNECGSVVKKFFSVLRSEFQISTKAWGILFAAGALLTADIWVCWVWADSSLTMIGFLKGITVLFGVVYSCSFSYVFSGIARYVVSLSQAFRNSLILAVQNMGYTVLVLILYFILCAAVYLVGILAFPAVILILYCLSKLYLRIFERSDAQQNNQVT